MEDMDEMPGDFGINYDAVAKAPNLSSVTKLLARDITGSGYITPGSWFKSLSDRDIDSLMELVDCDDEDEERMGELMLITLMLTKAEGIVIKDDLEFAGMIGAMRMLTATVSLARKGLVNVFYENISFGQDAGSLIVAERRDDVDYDKIRREIEGEDE